MAAKETTSNPSDEMDNKTDLTRYQTRLALDRTMLAWVRTTLSMVSFGFGMTAFFRSLYRSHPAAEMQRLHLVAIVFGVALLVIGLIAMALAGVTQLADLRLLMRGEVPTKRQFPLTIAVTALLLLLSVLGTIAVLTL